MQKDIQYRKLTVSPCQWRGGGILGSDDGLIEGISAPRKCLDKTLMRKDSCLEKNIIRGCMYVNERMSFGRQRRRWIDVRYNGLDEAED